MCSIGLNGFLAKPGLNCFRSRLNASSQPPRFVLGGGGDDIVESSLEHSHFSIPIQLSHHGSLSIFSYVSSLASAFWLSSCTACCDCTPRLQPTPITTTLRPMTEASTEWLHTTLVKHPRRPSQSKSVLTFPESTNFAHSLTGCATGFSPVPW